MTARNAATIASLALLGFVSACASFYEIPIETPISPKMDVSGFQRVLVAGFISGGTDDVDGNLETVRLLRSQLRSKSSLRVIEAEVLPLAELAAGEGKSATSATTGAGDVAPVPALESAQQTPQPQDAKDAKDPKIRSAKDLEKYQAIFSDVAFWKKIGEEYQNPLIVTGTVLFTPHQVNGFVTRNQEVYDNLGRRSVVPVRTYMERKGFILAPNFIFIDGRTGAQLHKEGMSEEILYSSQQNTPALSSYFELMDRVLPAFLGTLSTQKIRGTRILLR
jgi:hypothetical protein